MQNKQVVEMAQLAVLVAILLLMAFTPIGYFRTGGLEVSLLTIPVAVGAMLVGPLGGAFLGGVFGLTSFYQCFGLSPFGAALLGIHPFFTFVVCVPTRILMGWLCGWLFKPLYSASKIQPFSFFLGGALAALLNTLLFMGALLALFGQTEYIMGIRQSLGAENLLLFVLAFVGINGLLEIPLTSLLAGGISKALHKAL